MNYNDKQEKLIKSLVFSVIIMLVPMVIAVRILNRISYLAPLYAVSYVLQFILIFSVLLRVALNRNDILAIFCYLIILLLPIIRNIFICIETNIYDYLNLIIKVLNFTIFYLLIKHCRVQQKYIQEFMHFLVVFSVFACMYALIFDRNEILSLKYISNTNLIEVKGFFPSRNQFASFLLTAIIANLFLCVDKNNKKINCLIFVLQILCIGLSFSRGALYSVIIVFAMLSIQSNKHYKKHLTIFVIAAILAVILLNSNLYDFFARNYIRTTDFDTGRFKLWEYAWRIAKDNLITGIGFYSGVDIAASLGMKMTQFHSMYMDLLVGGGVLELGFVLSILTLTYRRCVKKCPNKQYVKIFRSGFVAFLVYSGVESSSIFALGYADTLSTIFYISIPILMSNMKELEPINSNQLAKTEFVRVSAII